MFTPTGKDVNCVVIYWDVRRLAVLGYLTAQGEGIVLEINVTPDEREKRAASDPGVQGQQHGGAEVVKEFLVFLQTAFFSQPLFTRKQRRLQAFALVFGQVTHNSPRIGFF